MSWNVRAPQLGDGRDLWPLRHGRMRSLLRTRRPAVLGLQEVVSPMAWALGGALPEHVRVDGVAAGARLFPVRSPIFVHRSLRVVDEGGFWLSETPARRSRGWDGRHVRSATWVKIETDGRALLVVNVHLDHEGEQARERSVDLVLTRLRALGWPQTPAVWLGDFNVDAGSALYTRVVAAGFVDTHRAAAQPDDDSAFTYHGFVGRRCPPDRRIDWILCSPPLTTRSASIVRDGGAARWPSDHFPVIAELGWG